MWVGGPKEGALLCDYPLQSLRLRLSGVEPSKAAWNQEAVDFLHCTFVDQEVTVDTSHCEDMGDIGAICSGTVATLTGQDAATLLTSMLSLPTMRWRILWWSFLQYPHP